MNWISKLLGGSVGGVVEQIGGVVDKFHLSGEEKQRFKLEMEALLQKRDSEIEQSLRAELQAKEHVLVAELTQGDNYTKRARPTVVYAGLAFIVFNYCLVPTAQSLLGVDVQEFALPTAFWAGWSGIVATWSIGRTIEKRGGRNAFTRVVVGGGAPSLLDDAGAGRPVG